VNLISNKILHIAYFVEAAEEGQSVGVEALSSYCTATIEEVFELLLDGGGVGVFSVIDDCSMEVSVGFQLHKHGVRDVADVTVARTGNTTQALEDIWLKRETFGSLVEPVQGSECIASCIKKITQINMTIVTISILATICD
jgi:hypothetical protein